ncbi:MAG: phosphoribosyl-ATP diphosphatase [Christensenellaceae bacterium]|nr:phosphoribosyl-ATP diphosphatase [Christensenellaceae bacterium]
MKNTNNVLNDLYEVIQMRKSEKIEGSYTCYLFEKGLDKILKKCGEECTEMIVAAKNNNSNEIIAECADLIYHIEVMLAASNIPIDDVLIELEKRAEKQRNLKQMKTVNKDS